MPATYTLIASNTLSSAAASVTFSAIPGTYTDLVLRCSTRSDRTVGFDWVNITFNSVGGTSYSQTTLEADGASASSARTTGVAQIRGKFTDDANNTSNTFGSFEIYIPNYAGSSNKPMGWTGVMETNATTAYMAAGAGLFSNTSAITEIVLDQQGGPNWVSGSSFFLYGIKNS